MPRSLLFLQALLSLLFAAGATIWYLLETVETYHRRPVEPGILQDWSKLPGQPEFLMVLVQAFYPLFWACTRKRPWPLAWWVLRTLHLIGAMLVLLVVGLFVLYVLLDDGWKN